MKGQVRKKWAVGVLLAGTLGATSLLPRGSSATEPCSGPDHVGEVLHLEVVSQTIDGVPVEVQQLPVFRRNAGVRYVGHR